MGNHWKESNHESYRTIYQGYEPRQNGHLPCQVVNSATDTIGRDSSLPHTDKRKSVSQAKRRHGYANHTPQSGIPLSKRRSAKRMVGTPKNRRSLILEKRQNWRLPVLWQIRDGSKICYRHPNRREEPNPRLERRPHQKRKRPFLLARTSLKKQRRSREASLSSTLFAKVYVS